MKYRTVIELTTEAENENEAVDIAGEFLRGNLESGVQMKCRTKSLKSQVLSRVGILLILLFIFVGIVSVGYFRSIPTSFSRIENVSAFGPPLKTSQTTAFKDAWQEEENKKVLEYIKNK